MTVKEYLQKQLSYNKEKRNILDNRINELQELIHEMDGGSCIPGKAPERTNPELNIIGRN